MLIFCNSALWRQGNSFTFLFCSSPSPVTSMINIVNICKEYFCMLIDTTAAFKCSSQNFSACLLLTQTANLVGREITWPILECSVGLRKNCIGRTPSCTTQRPVSLSRIHLHSHGFRFLIIHQLVLTHRRMKCHIAEVAVWILSLPTSRLCFGMLLCVENSLPIDIQHIRQTKKTEPIFLLDSTVSSLKCCSPFHHLKALPPRFLCICESGLASGCLKMNLWPLFHAKSRDS